MFSLIYRCRRTPANAVAVPAPFRSAAQFQIGDQRD